jgi:DNA topoisomerase-1
LQLDNLAKDPDDRRKLYHKNVIAKQEYQTSIGRYTESSLIADLEKRGIGRPSTYASLMESISTARFIPPGGKKGDTKISYVETKDHTGTEKEIETITLSEDNEIKTKTSKTMLGKEAKKLTITPLGMMIIPFLIDHFDNIMNYKFTGQIENELDQIMNKSKTYVDVVSFVHNTFHPIVETLMKEQSKAPKNISSEDNCLGEYDNEQIVLKDGKFGHYMIYNGINYSLKYADKKVQNAIIKNGDLEIAINFIKEKDEAKIRKETTTYNVGKYELFQAKNGKYYFKDTKDNLYGVGDSHPKHMVEAQCDLIIQNEKERKAFLKKQKKPENNKSYEPEVKKKATKKKSVAKKKEPSPINKTTLFDVDDDY